MRYVWIMFISFLLIIVSSSCSFLQNEDSVKNDAWLPPPKFNEADLIGIWRNDWIEGPSTEIIILKADKTFIQTYTIHSSGQKYEIVGTWWLENGSGDCTYIHADKMRYYEFGIRAVQRGNRDVDGYPEMFWDNCQKKFVEMPDFVLLGIGSDNDQEPPIFLYHMAIDYEHTSKIFWRINAP